MKTSRAGRQCHGYRDTSGLRFADMSAVVAQRAKKVNPPEPICKHASEIGIPTAASHPQNGFIVPGRPNPADTIENIAASYFHQHFVIGNSRPFKYIEPIYGNMGPPLIMSIRAVGLASLSKTHRSTDLETRARHCHLSAIRLINKALGTPQATDEDTLSSILLLDQWDKIIPPVHRSKQAYINHLNGVMELMKLRGPKQFNNKIGLEMFVHMRSHLLMTCLQQDVPIPTSYLSLHAYASNYFDGVSHELAEVTVRFVTLFSQIRNGTFSGTERIIKTATEEDQRVANLVTKISLEVNRKAVSQSFPSDLVYGSHYDVWADLDLGRVSNQLLPMRVALLDLILHEAASSHGSLPPPFLAMVRNANEKFVYCINTICASIPQQLGYLSLLESKQTTTTFSSSPGTSRFKLDKSYIQSACVLLWPLFVVANSYNCPESARTWIINIFRVIGKTQSLERALEAVTILESGGRAKIWDSFWYVESIFYLDYGIFCNSSGLSLYSFMCFGFLD